MQTTGENPPRTAASGTDQTGTVTVTVDASGELTDVAISTLPEPLRVAEQLTRSFDEALTRAYANGYPAAPPPPGQDILVAQLPRRFERGDFRKMVERAMNDRGPRETAPRSVLRDDIGVSRNECVTVQLDRTGPSGSATFDPGWLGQAREPNIAAALVEAFAAAYETRRNR